MSSSFTRNNGEKRELTVRELAELSFLGTMSMVAQVIMAPLPNIEPVTTILICLSLVYGAKAFYACAVFVFLEGLIYGFGFWFINYLYVWPILIAVVLLLRQQDHLWVWVTVSAVFGLMFGALCAIPYLFLGGVETAFVYWLSGIPFDILHCAGNGVLCFVLLRPLRRALGMLNKRNI